MSIINIFSPFYWKQNLPEQQELWNEYVPKIIENYQNAPTISPDWNVHTSYNVEHLLKNRIDWNIGLEVYRKYIDQFIIEYFGQKHDWELCGGMWYTAYGANQTANIHEHIPDQFSIVHYIKFDPTLHWPISFINPQGAYTKMLLGMYPGFKDKINFNNQQQSLYHPRFTPSTEQGDLLIFPSHLEHMVEKVESPELRISIAFNIKLK